MLNLIKRLKLFFHDADWSSRSKHVRYIRSVKQLSRELYILTVSSLWLNILKCKQVGVYKKSVIM